VPQSTNDLRIIQLTQGVADDVAQLVLKIISDAIVTPTSPSVTQPTTTTTPVAPGIIPGGTAQSGAPGQRYTGGPNGTASATTKSTALTFFSSDGRAVEAGLLEDIHITADSRHQHRDGVGAAQGDGHDRDAHQGIRRDPAAQGRDQDLPAAEGRRGHGGQHPATALPEFRHQHDGRYSSARLRRHRYRRHGRHQRDRLDQSAFGRRSARGLRLSYDSVTNSVIVPAARSTS